MDTNRFIGQQRLIICPKCQQASRTPVAITSGMLPVRLTCPRCNLPTLTFDKIPELPKVAPPQQDQWWTVEGTEKLDDQTVEPLEEEAEPTNRLHTFSSRAEQISSHLFDGLEMIYTLNRDIHAFEKSFYDHFTESSQLAQVFNSWRPEYIKEFVHYPFAVMKIECENQLASMYARLVMAPKFIRPGIGIPLQSKGGFHLELITQYSLISIPILSKKLRDYLDLPPDLSLYVQGTKIMGSTLDHCWRDIPGTLEDAGHTEDDPSIIMHPQKGASCRMWLAEHGIAGWTPTEIPEKITFFADADIQFNHQTKAESLHTEAWQVLKTNSRIGIFWRNIMESRDFAVKAGNCIKGPKLVLTSREEDIDSWHACGAQGNSMSGRWLFYSEPNLEKKINIEMIRDVRMIVLDHLYAVNSMTLQMLYEYQGILIVLSSDPFLDFHSENFRAPLLHGLVCCSLYDCDDVAVRPEGAVWHRALGWESPILHALADIQKLPGQGTDHDDTQEDE